MRSFTPTKDLAIGYFGASIGAAALGLVIPTVVSRGGPPDLVWAALEHVQPPTLLIVGGRDDLVIDLN